MERTFCLYTFDFRRRMSRTSKVILKPRLRKALGTSMLSISPISPVSCEATDGHDGWPLWDVTHNPYSTGVVDTLLWGWDIFYVMSETFLCYCYMIFYGILLPFQIVPALLNIGPDLCYIWLRCNTPSTAPTSNQRDPALSQSQCSSKISWNFSHCAIVKPSYLTSHGVVLPMGIHKIITLFTGIAILWLLPFLDTTKDSNYM